jgi:hypothetical protein
MLINLNNLETGMVTDKAIKMGMSSIGVNLGLQIIILTIIGKFLSNRMNLQMLLKFLTNQNKLKIHYL